MKRFTANVVKWFDRVNGNTYHSCRITRHSDGAELCCPFEYGYGEAYKGTALLAMVEKGWIDAKYSGSNYHMFERDNEYPIIWTVSDGLKRDCVANGKA